MNRISLIQEIFQNTDFENYLEIGCQTGKSFLPIKAKNKIAVDPEFKISLKNKIKWLIKEPRNFNNKFFEEESDTFFHKRKEFLKELGQLDVVLVDGLHTFRASLNDVLNSLKYLNTRGIIIMHDCLPPFKAAALPYYPSLEESKGIEGWTGQWTGDVWKTIVYLRRKFKEQLDTCVINMDFGLGIIRLKSKISKSTLVIDEEIFSEINKLTYEDLMENTKALLNLKDPEYSVKIVKEIASQNRNK